VNVVINGVSTEMDGSSTVVDAMTAVGHEGAGFGIAIALNGEVVVRSSWASTGLSDGDHLEILVAAQGG
jgi:sulfur carrier protein